MRRVRQHDTAVGVCPCGFLSPCLPSLSLQPSLQHPINKRSILHDVLGLTAAQSAPPPRQKPSTLDLFVQQHLLQKQSPAAPDAPHSSSKTHLSTAGCLTDVSISSQATKQQPLPVSESSTAAAAGAGLAQAPASHGPAASCCSNPPPTSRRQAAGGPLATTKQQQSTCCQHSSTRLCCCSNSTAGGLRARLDSCPSNQHAVCCARPPCAPWLQAH